MTYQIINLDCLNWMSRQADNSIDTIITSPPYNKKGVRDGQRTSNNIWQGSNIDYATYDDNLPEQDYQAWQINIINECYRIIKPTGSIFYQHKVRNWARKGYHPMAWISKSNAQFYQEIIWHRKSTMAMDERYLFNTTEKIYWLSKDKPNVYKQQVPEEYRSDVWTISPARNNEHPAPFPEQLAKNCILLTTKEDDIVYDPFGGSGTTLYVADSLKRTAITTEIDPNYITMIENRMNNTYTQLFA